MKTVVDAVNELEGDFYNARNGGVDGPFLMQVITNEYCADVKIGSFVRYTRDETKRGRYDVAFVCMEEEFNQCVAEMSEAKWIPEKESNMKTVGDFKNAGLVFVEGDEGNNYHIGAPLSFNSSCMWDYGVPESFVWRTNTGEKPEFVGKVEVKYKDGAVMIAHSGNIMFDGVTRGLANPVVKWRPSLNQSTTQTETPEEKEAFEAMTESKPVFTQAMADAGELPPVGADTAFCWRSEFEDESFHRTLKVIAYNEDKTQIWAHMDNNEHSNLYNLNRLKFQPIKSEREKAIDEMAQLDCRLSIDLEYNANEHASAIVLHLERLYDANYRKLTPSQAKAYDDKTEYFGEEYK